MPLCLHGTVGAAYVLFKEKGLTSLRCMTKNRGTLILRQEKDTIQVHVSAHQSPEIILDPIDVHEMLNLGNKNENTLPFVVSSVGSPKLLVPLPSFKSLASLKPNFILIKEWSIKNKVNGIYVYTKDTQNPFFNFYARAFNPLTGHNEDAATGVAAAALALSLKQSIVAGQGIFVQRPSEINVSYDNSENIWVGGRATFSSKRS